MCVINADGTNFIHLVFSESTGHQTSSFAHEWSLDSTKIIFWHSVRVPDPERLFSFAYRTIYVVNADGTKPVKVLRSSDVDPFRWSPNGTRFAVSYDDGVSGTSVVNADGTTLVRLPGFNYEG